MEKKCKPVLVGIAGGSGSGKTTFCELLFKALQGRKVLVISTDYYYKQTLPTMISPVSGVEYEDFNSPDSFDYQKLWSTVVASFTSDLCYDVILLEGISVLYFPDLRNLLDLKVFVDLDSDERMYRRIRRNVDTRNQNLEEVAQYYLESAKYRECRDFLPTKVYADIIVNGHTLDGIAVDMVTAWVLKRC